ncbi:DUF2130 domain-containing protein [Euryarchaeota archaeon]|nr:DUF2130 domain-containing protein [Euryarchaeota archaeon]|tara:strand:- start:28 stop:1341 length:1314 start_codon:yes stop_codon:yes gene_type:complete
MKEVKCPQCKSVFEMDAAGYAEILNQIKGVEFENELNNRINENKKSHQIELELTKKDAVTEKEKEISLLLNQISNHEREIDFAKKEVMNSLQKEIFDKDKQIDRLKNERKALQAETNLAVTEAKSVLEKDIIQLKNIIDNADTEKELHLQSLNGSHRTEIQAKEEIIRMKDEEIERVKDMKAKMSVKEIGEKLEQWCENQFNILRPSAFPNAFFEKDNTSVKEDDEKHGTKGDYIFRDSDSSGVEFISIMFEMKDKMEDTKGRTNESHLSKLDIDRRKKNCEYAVLVSMLEPENEFYNSGIVDMSHKYEKMYVVRPHYFIPILTLIRNEARKSLEMRQELAIIRSQNIDYENFENKLLGFQEGFGKNVVSARTNFDKAIKHIDETIVKLEKVKQHLTTSDNQLRLANNKTQDLSIKKLTKGNPTMKRKFEELKEEDE